MTSPLLNKDIYPILNERLHQHCENWKSEVPFLYHATKKSNLKSILNKGLLASCFGDIHGEMSIRPTKPGVYLSRHHTSNNLNSNLFQSGEEIVIIKIRTSNINPDDIYPDDALFVAFGQEDIFEDEEELRAIFNLPEEEARQLLELLCECQDADLANLMRPLWGWYLKVHGEISVSCDIPASNIVSVTGYETGIPVDIHKYHDAGRKVDVLMLQRIRDYLISKWNDRQIAIQQNKPLGEQEDSLVEDRGMSRYSALFLAEALEEVTGQSWIVEGGDVWLPEYPSGGFKDNGGNWNGHYWTTNGNIIVDLTAKQFGAKDIVVTVIDDSRYQANYDESELKDHLEHVERTVNGWLDDARGLNLFSPIDNDGELILF